MAVSPLCFPPTSITALLAAVFQQATPAELAEHVHDPCAICRDTLDTGCKLACGHLFHQVRHHRHYGTRHVALWHHRHYGTRHVATTGRCHSVHAIALSLIESPGLCSLASGSGLPANPPARPAALRSWTPPPLMAHLQAPTTAHPWLLSTASLSVHHPPPC